MTFFNHKRLYETAYLYQGYSVLEPVMPVTVLCSVCLCYATTENLSWCMNNKVR